MSRRAYSRLFYHFAWATKNRREIIVPEFEDRLYAHFKRKCEEYGFVYIAGGGMPEHVHLLLRAEPESAPSAIAGKIKGASSHFVKHGLLQGDEFEWQRGYGVHSVGDDGIKRVIAYIRNQKQHHGAEDIVEDWEKTETFEESVDDIFASP